MPVPPGLLIDIAVLIAREVWRSRRRRTLPASARGSTWPRASSRRLSPIGRLLRLAAIATILWLVWREVTRRRDALIAARRVASATATPPPMPPAASPVPVPPLPPVVPGAPESREAAAAPRAPGAGEEAAQAGSVDDRDARAKAMRNSELIGWCARCREHYPMQQVTFTTNASGRRIARGVCLVCGAGIIRFVAHAQEADDSVS